MRQPCWLIDGIEMGQCQLVVSIIACSIDACFYHGRKARSGSTHPDFESCSSPSYEVLDDDDAGDDDDDDDEVVDPEPFVDVLDVLLCLFTVAFSCSALPAAAADFFATWPGHTNGMLTTSIACSSRTEVVCGWLGCCTLL